ncbi:MAG: hypothetical protein GY835_19045 [bacterium]|nr:hypothetical protein [bacterium]
MMRIDHLCSPSLAQRPKDFFFVFPLQGQRTDLGVQILELSFTGGLAAVRFPGEQILQRFA